MLRGARVGGKAASLERLRPRVPVPAFAVLEADVFDAFLRDAGLDELFRQYWRAARQGPDSQLLQRARDGLIRALLLCPLPPGVQERLAAVYESVPADVKVARSSASQEDGPGRSWAGQFRTVFNIS